MIGIVFFFLTWFALGTMAMGTPKGTLEERTRPRPRDKLGGTPLAIIRGPDQPAPERESMKAQVQRTYDTLTNMVVGHVQRVKVRQRQKKIPRELLPLFDAVKDMDLAAREQFANLLLNDVRVRQMKFGTSSCTMGDVLDISPAAPATIPITLGANGQDQAVVGLDSTRLLRIDGTRAMTGALAMGAQKITGMANGVAATDAATVSQVSASAAGLDAKGSCVATTTAALPACTYANGALGVGATLTADGNGALAAQDGVTLIVDERLLVKNQVAGLQNGIYTLTQVGDAGTPFILTRATDSDEAAEVPNAYAWIEEGTTLDDTGWVCTTNIPITMGTTALSFTQFTGLGQITTGDALTKTGDTIDVDNDNPALVLGEANLAGTDDIGCMRADSQVAIFEDAVSDIIECDDAATKGVAAFAARRDHTHGIVCGEPPSDLIPEQANAEGSYATFARTDHMHMIPEGTPVDVSLAANGAGDSTDFARGNHQHKIAETIAPTWTGKHIHDVGGAGTAIQLGNAAGDDQDIVPHTTGKGSVGTAALKLKLVTALTVDSGDYRYCNGWKSTELWEDGSVGIQGAEKGLKSKGLVFLNQKGERVFHIDEEGNLHLKGDIEVNSKWT